MHPWSSELEWCKKLLNLHRGADLAGRLMLGGPVIGAREKLLSTVGRVGSQASYPTIQSISSSPPPHPANSTPPPMAEQSGYHKVPTPGGGTEYKDVPKVHRQRGVRDL